MSLRSSSESGKEEVNFLRLLVVLVVLFVVHPLISGTGVLSSSLVNLLFIAAVAIAATSVPGRRVVRSTVYSTGAVAFLSSWAAILWGQTWVELVVYGSYLGFFTLVCANVLGHVFRGGEVDTNKLYAVCCVYLLAGIAWAFLYALIETSAPGSFHLADGVVGSRDRISQLIYFSLVTLTTLGYGDIVPISGFARTTASLEAIFGQAYLAVLVARLIGLRLSSKREVS